MDYELERGMILADYDLARANIQTAYELRYIDYVEMANRLREARQLRDLKLQELYDR